MIKLANRTYIATIIALLVILSGLVVFYKHRENQLNKEIENINSEAKKELIKQAEQANKSIDSILSSQVKIITKYKDRKIKVYEKFYFKPINMDSTISILNSAKCCVQ